ncbi:hypothetical protein B0H63DRAFT_534503 [Podospora didyma]|uniref:Uncharacterized protein n=1 Tax=Podospora didyma TaxID=330526 RepID=A0AAE0K1I1_9PEZI|nr:hypothetical protein B0H63DRAFT_534503 [Podospora didyma]
MSNCSELGVEFQSDPDVAGLGVVLAFLITSWVSFAAALINFLIVEDGVPSNLTTHLDKGILKVAKILRDKLPWTPSRSHMHEICMMLGDQQLVTAASILLVCFLTQDTMTQYHFGIGASLAWASFSTFQSILTIVSHDLQREGCSWMKIWRYAWIFAITAAATFANFVFADRRFLEPERWGTPVSCVLTSLGVYDKKAATKLTLFTLMNVNTAVATLNLLWPSARQHSISRWLRKHIWTLRDMPRIAQGWINSTWWFNLALADVLCSFNFGLFRAYVVLLFSTKIVLDLRRDGPSHGLQKHEEEDNVKKFGQLLSLVFLALPFLEISEILWNEFRANKKLRMNKYKNIANPSQHHATSVKASAKPKTVPNA